MPDFPIPAGELLPHAPPMLCVNALRGVFDDNKALVEAVLTPGHMLLDHHGLLVEAGYVELAAQAAGTLKGYKEKIQGLPVRDGFLAAAQDFFVFAVARQGDVLHVSVTVLAEIAGVSLIAAEVLRFAKAGETQLLAKGKLKVYTPDEHTVP